MDDQVNAIGVLISFLHEPFRSEYLEKKGRGPKPEQLSQARQELETAQLQWAAAVSDAEALLRDRQEGGE